jgi:hypothetical protein
MDLDEITEVLRPLADGLASDGYLLFATTEGRRLTVRVEAGPEACAECLVPKTLFDQIVLTKLRSVVGELVDAGLVDISYPGE